MAEASDTLGILRQNLVDAGCGDETISRCLSLADSGQWEKLLPLMAKEKVALLETAHANRRKIDCLDFLVYEIKKKHIGRNER